MSKVQVFDPPMCCSTGVCGPEVDPSLVRFAADLEWLKSKGVAVERFNLGQEPAAFVAHAVVAEAMRARDDALPVLLVDGKAVHQGGYPGRAELAQLVGVEAPASSPSEATEAPQACCAPGDPCCVPAEASAPVALSKPGAKKKCCC